MNWDLIDYYYEEYIARGGYEIDHRMIIDLNKKELKGSDIELLKNYVWKGNYLIPYEIVENRKDEIHN